MTRKQVLGFAVGASLLFGFDPIAEAVPLAASSNALEMSASTGIVVQARVVRRVARRTTRRVVRRHYY